MQHALSTSKALRLSTRPGNQNVYAEARNPAPAPSAVPAAIPTPTLADDEWDALFQAVTERLSLLVRSRDDETVSAPAHLHDMVNSVPTAIDECVGDLQMLARVVREERSCRSRELEVARVQDALARALIDFAVTAS